METKWTPGPWRVLTEREETGFRMVRSYVLSGPDADGMFPDGEILAKVESTRDAQEDANANLIAAAPALYEALACAEDLFAHTVGMMTFSGDGDNQSRNEGEVHRILKEVRAALALARGEHPTVEEA